MTGADAVGRVIARPFTGAPGAFERTTGRKDFSVDPPSRTYLDELAADGVPVHAVGKVHDLFAGQVDHRGAQGQDQRRRPRRDDRVVAGPGPRPHLHQPGRDRPALRPPPRRRGLRPRAAGDRRRGRRLARAARSRRPPDPDRRPRRRPALAPTPTTPASTSRCWPPRPRSPTATATTARCPTSARPSCSGSPAARRPSCRARRSWRAASTPRARGRRRRGAYP